MKKLKPLTLILLLHYSIPIHSQNDSGAVKAVIEDLHQFWKRYTYTTHITNDSTGIENSRAFFNSPVFIPNQVPKQNLREKEIELKIQVLKKDWGLKFATSYIENFNPSFNDDDNLIYNRRIQAGLNWDILNSGIVENNTLIKTLELQNLILQSIKLPGNDNEEITIKWNQLIYLFNLIKLDILKERLLLVKKQNDAAEKLFLSKYLTKELFIENEKRLAEIQSLYNIYKEFNNQLILLGIKPETENYYFPLIDINYPKIFKSSSNITTNKDTLLNIIRKKNELESKYYNQINLNAFMRYNYYNLIISNPSSRAFMSAGINLSVPINFNQKEQHELNEVKSLNEYDRVIHQENSQQENLLDDCYEFRYKLKQYIVFYQKKLLFQELLRKEKARYAIDPISFNPYKVISMQDDILAIDLELVELKQNMYLKILKINAHSNEKNIASLFYPYLLNEHADDSLVINESVYAWSGVFQNHDTSFIKEYIIYNDFKTVAISSGNNDTLWNIISNANASLRKAGALTELLIGDNKFLEKNIDSYFKQKALSPSAIDAIHIDFEPQTFSDWHEKKSQYLQTFYIKLKEVKQFCNENKLKLKIAIPLYYPEEDVNGYLELCDEVVFMAYENTNSKYITEKLSKYISKKSKIAIALRTNDFINRPAMEDKQKELIRMTGIENYYIHDLSRLITWDETSIEKK